MSKRNRSLEKTNNLFLLWISSPKKSCRRGENIRTVSYLFSQDVRLKKDKWKYPYWNWCAHLFLFGEDKSLSVKVFIVITFLKYNSTFYEEEKDFLKSDEKVIQVPTISTGPGSVCRAELMLQRTQEGPEMWSFPPTDDVIGYVHNKLFSCLGKLNRTLPAVGNGGSFDNHVYFMRTVQKSPN